MMKINPDNVAQIHALAETLRSNPSLAHEVLQQPLVFFNDAASIDVYSIYMHLMNAVDPKNTADIDKIHVAVLTYITNQHLKLDNIRPHISIPEVITSYLLMSIMMSGGILHDDNRELEFDTIMRMLGKGANDFFENGNTPLIWAIANSNLPAFHKLIAAMQRTGMMKELKIDIHCKDFCQGSALFLACVKGENHIDTLNRHSSHPMDRMQSAIKVLLDCGASPTDESESTGHYSPLEIAVLRRSPALLQLMLQNLHEPLGEEVMERINLLLNEDSYERMKEEISTLSAVNTLPSKDEWVANLDEMHAILAQYQMTISDDANRRSTL